MSERELNKLNNRNTEKCRQTISKKGYGSMVFNNGHSSYPKLSE
jgi:hypothetical protein